ncbi:glycosyltransferase family 2 protein [Pontibacter qinzhouensis]|uniref:Glycosyltransferase family 2 protein n=1 Tax=Pontibacter qinzhouensis TaxID=2603253 RepID=A0A5C8JAS6_9BACT|nr:glycosyltransferase family 2 protein [Pontibacter qinzhouensis]TXK33787.1 glycosyltransferase family 2 protein [Pontibacter qinzhouensis]
MFVIDLFFDIVLYSLGIFLLLNCCYLLFFSLAGHKKVKPLQELLKKDRRFCILIPAYQENEVILETSKAALNHQYAGTFDVFVIADGLLPETIATLQNTGVGVIEVAFEKSTKGKALAAALNALPENTYDIAAILDVDNIMGADFLQEVNKAFGAGYKVVQAHRTAKNLDSTFAFLDACNEEINNHIYRKGHFAVGMSSALIGSGMAFGFTYLKELLNNIGETVGEDKELDFRIAKNQDKICYLDKVYVYDEKIENAKVFTQQRTRWIAAQLEFMKKYAGEGVTQFLKFGNYEFFNKVAQAFLVPRMLLIGVLGLLFLASLVLPFGPAPAFWGVLLLLLGAALFIALPGRFYKNPKLWKAFIQVPYAIFCMAKALFQVNKAKKSFLSTPHKVKAVSTEVHV